jgi:DNA repair exonuclease SbcCD nuclease subunit
MKILIYSDIQFNPWREFSEILPNGRNSRFQDQLNVQQEIFEYAISSDVELVIHTGDLFETLSERIDKQVFLTVFDYFVQFSKAGVATILLVGNHDKIRKGETDYTILSPFREIDNVLVIDSPVTQVVDDTSLVFIPHTREKFGLEVKNQIKAVKTKHKYLFSHQGVTGAIVGPRDEILKDEYTINDFGVSFFEYVFNGHYHKPQTLGGGKFRGVGSPIQRDFGERADRKGFIILDTDEGKIEYIETKTPPRFFKVFGEEIPKDYRQGKDFLWLVSKENTDVLRTTYSELGMRVRIDAAEKEIETRTRSDLSISLPVEEQLAKYIEYTKSELDAKKLLEYGINKYKRAQ